MPRSWSQRNICICTNWMLKLRCARRRFCNAALNFNCLGLSLSTTHSKTTGIFVREFQSRLPHDSVLGSESPPFRNYPRWSLFTLILTSLALSWLDYVLSLCENGNIKDYWKKHEVLEISTKLRWVKSIAFSIAALHEVNILHGDIKPENCVLDTQLNVFLCDFNVAQQLEGPTATIPNGPGSAPFMAPEATLTHRGLPCDIWAFGCLIFELFTNELPFQGQSDWLIIQAVRNHALTWKAPLLSPEKRNMPFTERKDSNTSEDEFHWQLSDLVSRCLVPDPSQRITASEIASHPVFSCKL